MEKNPTIVQFIEQVRQARARWDGLVDHLSDEQMLQPCAGGEWSIKDIQSHITWHDREMVVLVRGRALAGSDLWELPLDQRNQAIFELTRDRPLLEVRAQARQVFAALMQELATLSDEELSTPGKFSDMPEDWLPWEMIASNTYEHYDDHFTALQSWLGRAS